LQGGTAAGVGEELFTREQLIAFEYLTLQTIDRNGEDLTDDALDNGDDAAHGIRSCYSALGRLCTQMN
jgi:hypothetical protein